MAVDEAVASAVGAREAPPTLRLYSWRPPAVSIGYAQRLGAEVDLDALRRRGWGWVRRPTGGRAVLHADEVTYAVMLPDDGVGVLETYARLSRGLIAGLRRLGAAAEWFDPRSARGPGRSASAACFDAPSAYEVAVGGRKLVGSAQTRRWGAVLQHGSLPLSLDRAAHGEVFGAGPELVAALAARACALGEVVGRVPAWEALVAALAGGFAEALGVTLRGGCLTAAERDAAAALATGRYGSEVWNARR